jgi:hypothetical protein
MVMAAEPGPRYRLENAPWKRAKTPLWMLVDLVNLLMNPRTQPAPGCGSIRRDRCGGWLWRPVRFWLFDFAIQTENQFLRFFTSCLGEILVFTDDLEIAFL